MSSFDVQSDFNDKSPMKGQPAVPAQPAQVRGGAVYCCACKREIAGWQACPNGGHCSAFPDDPPQHQFDGNGPILNQRCLRCEKLGWEASGLPCQPAAVPAQPAPTPHVSCTCPLCVPGLWKAGIKGTGPIPPTSAPTPVCELCGKEAGPGWCPGGAPHGVHVAQPLADICPSCGRTDPTEHAPCANAWHGEDQPQPNEQLVKSMTTPAVWEGQPQQDGPIPLPKELANWHEDLCGERNGTEIRSRIVAEDVIPLIERIGRAEAALKQAREALGHIANDGMDAQMCMITARAALAATQPKEGE